MVTVDVHAGEPVYIRSFSTRRAAVAQVLGFVRVEGQTWVRVRFMTAWYDWDTPHTEARTTVTRGEELLVAPTQLEAIRR